MAIITEMSQEGQEGTILAASTDLRDPLLPQQTQHSDDQQLSADDNNTAVVLPDQTPNNSPAPQNPYIKISESTEKSIIAAEIGSALLLVPIAIKGINAFKESTDINRFCHDSNRKLQTSYDIPSNIGAFMFACTTNAALFANKAFYQCTKTNTPENIDLTRNTSIINKDVANNKLAILATQTLTMSMTIISAAMTIQSEIQRKAGCFDYDGNPKPNSNNSDQEIALASLYGTAALATLAISAIASYKLGQDIAKAKRESRRDVEMTEFSSNGQAPGSRPATPALPNNAQGNHGAYAAV